MHIALITLWSDRLVCAGRRQLSLREALEMATTKKASTGTKAGAGARKGATKANGVAKESKSKTTARAATAPKKAVPIKLNDRQREFLKKIKDAVAGGYDLARKVEQRTIDALVEWKLVKKGAKNKETGKQPYLLTKAGEKHLPTAPSTPISTSEPAAAQGPVTTPPIFPEQPAP